MTILNIKPGGQGSAGSQSGASAGGVVIDVDERSFQAEVVERSRSVPVVIDFWAPWCGPCRTLGPTLEKLAHEAKGAWVLAKVNVDNNPRLAQAFQVQGIPAVKAVRDGRLTGAQPESQVRAWLQRFVPAAGSQPSEDLGALEARDPRAAEQRYRQLLVEDSQNNDARLGLGRLLAQARNPEGAELLREIKIGTPQHAIAQAWLTLAALTSEIDESAAFDLLGRVDDDPADLEARYQLAAHQIAGRRYEDAIENLLAVVMRNRGFREDGARKVLLALFAALGDQNPLVVAGRRQLANLLF
jgi:putative thioredoxin